MLSGNSSPPIPYATEGRSSCGPCDRGPWRPEPARPGHPASNLARLGSLEQPPNVLLGTALPFGGSGSFGRRSVVVPGGRPGEPSPQPARSQFGSSSSYERGRSASELPSGTPYLRPMVMTSGAEPPRPAPRTPACRRRPSSRCCSTADRSPPPRSCQHPRIPLRRQVEGGPVGSADDRNADPTAAPSGRVRSAGHGAPTLESPSGYLGSRPRQPGHDRLHHQQPRSPTARQLLPHPRRPTAAARRLSRHRWLRTAASCRQQRNGLGTAHRTGALPLLSRTDRLIVPGGRVRR